MISFHWRVVELFRKVTKLNNPYHCLLNRLDNQYQLTLSYFYQQNNTQVSENMQNTGNSFQNAARNTLYSTVNQEYGSVWAQDGTRPQHLNIKTATIPTYSEVVDSINHYQKAERLIKNKIINAKLQQLNIDPEHRINKVTQFPVKDTTKYIYPQHGLNVGPAIYRTNNMNYGSSVPAQFQVTNKYYPSNNTFTKGFPGGNYKFNGLNTTKTVSGVHNGLNDF